MQSTRELTRIELTPRSDGLWDCYLRKNIKSKQVAYNDITQTIWEADEVRFVTDKTAEDIEPEFDILWTEAVDANMTDEDRNAKFKTDILDIQESIVEIYEAMLTGGV